MANKERKKILVDTTSLFDQYSKRGIGRTGREILLKLIPLLLTEGIEVNLIGFKNLESNLIDIGFSQFSIDEYAKLIKFHTLGEVVPSGVRNIKRWENQYVPLINDIKPELYFAIHFERGLPSNPKINKDIKVKCKTAVICYDVIPLKTCKYSNNGFLRNIIKRRFYKKMWEGVKYSDLVITISDFSKKEIESIKGVNSKKVKAYHLGISEDFYKSHIENEYDKDLIDQVLELYNLKDKKYFFYDSGVEANKGINELLYIFQNIDKNLNTYYLTIVGGDFNRGIGNEIKAKTSAGEKLLKLAKKYNVLNNLVTTGRIVDRDLIILLSKSSYYINLSSYEGFGFGLAQAMACEIPIIASNKSSYPEVTQKKALLLNLNNLDEDSKDVIEYINNVSQVNKNVVEALEVVNKYTWENNVENIFKELVGLIK